VDSTGREHDKTERTELADELLHLYDEISEFNDCCAFLCDAFCSLAAEERALDTSTIEGLKCFSYWIKQRVAEVKAQLKTVQERVFSDEEHCGSAGVRN
jgi:hypothetical protein